MNKRKGRMHSALFLGVMMDTGFIDMHCHILPCVDDGSKGMDMTIEMLRYSYEQGVRGICFTPHDYDRRSKSDVAGKRSAYEAVASYISGTYPDMKTWIGTEVTYRRGVESELKKGETLSLGGSRYVLIEFHPTESYREIDYGLRSLQQYGYEPVIAHVERVEELFLYKERIAELKRQGIYLQMNTESITGGIFDARAKRCRMLVKDGLIDCFGTDAHNLDFRKPDYRAAALWLSKHVGEEETKRLTSFNALKMLEDSVC